LHPLCAMSAIAVTSPEHFQTLLSADLQRVSLINFWAPWAEPCNQMNQVVEELAKKYPKLLALHVDAGEQQDIAESFEINAVPSFIILRGHTLLKRISGADAGALTAAVGEHTPKVSSVIPRSSTDQSPPAPVEQETTEQLNSRLRGLTGQSKVVLFMKGSPQQPRCGFSRQIVGILDEHKVEYTTFDILTDESVRSGLKVYNNWPTYPQLIINGEFVGGLDVVKEMVANGELQELLA